MNFSHNLTSMALPTMFPPFDLYSVLPPPQVTQSRQEQSWRQNFCGNTSGTLLYSTTSSTSYAVLTDSRRIQGMETTIQYLRDLLAEEVSNNVTLKNKLNSSIEAHKLLKEQCQEAIAGMKNEALQEMKAFLANFDGAIKANHDPTASRSQLKDFKAENKDVKAETTGELLETRVDEAQKVNQTELDAAQQKLEEAKESIKVLENEKTMLQAKIEELSSELTKQKYASRLQPTNSIINQSSTRGGETNSETKDQSFDDAVNQEHANSVARDNILSLRFKEVAKKHLLSMLHIAELANNDLVCKHNEFVKRLRSEMDNCSETNGAKRSMLRQTIETVESQLDMISDCREEFKVTVDFLLDRIDKELVLVCDLNISPPKPEFEIPLCNFEPILKVISSDRQNSI